MQRTRSRRSCAVGTSSSSDRNGTPQAPRSSNHVASTAPRKTRLSPCDLFNRVFVCGRERSPMNLGVALTVGNSLLCGAGTAIAEAMQRTRSRRSCAVGTSSSSDRNGTPQAPRSSNHVASTAPRKTRPSPCDLFNRVFVCGRERSPMSLGVALTVGNSLLCGAGTAIAEAMQRTRSRRSCAVGTSSSSDRNGTPQVPRSSNHVASTAPRKTRPSPCDLFNRMFVCGCERPPMNLGVALTVGNSLLCGAGTAIAEAMQRTRSRRSCAVGTSSSSDRNGTPQAPRSSNHVASTAPRKTRPSPCDLFNRMFVCGCERPPMNLGVALAECRSGLARSGSDGARPSATCSDVGGLVKCPPLFSTSAYFQTNISSVLQYNLIECWKPLPRGQ